MIAWFRRLFGHSPPTRRQIMALEDALEGLETRVEQRYQELKALRGVVNARIRRQEDAPATPGDAIDEAADLEGLPRRPSQPAPSAHLSRRFRVGG